MPEPTKPKAAEATPNGVSPDVAALIAKVNELAAQNADLAAQVSSLQRTISVERPMALPLKIAQDREEWFEKTRADLSRSCLERTQEKAEQLWGKDTKDRYRVHVADQLELLIPARSPEEARGRYDKISGIISVDLDKHKYKIELVSNAA